MSFHAADRLLGFEIPPEQLTVVTARHDRGAVNQNDSSDVALMPFALERFGLRLFGESVHLIELEVRTAENQPIAVGHARDTERDARQAKLFDKLQPGRVG